MEPGFWPGKRVLITGHTGFKGSWLALWLQAMGAEVSGYALAPPTDPSMFESARVGRGMARSYLADVRDLAALQQALAEVRPEIVFHMAAQPLVSRSYAQPVETYAVNVQGTVHLLEAVRTTPGVRAVVAVTTDKCYENHGGAQAFRETDPLGGHDPYSNSKGCAELVVSAYRSSFLGPAGIALASARAGNVIGGGDWAEDRVVPDAIRAFQAGAPVTLRSPGAIRPWQHVLEPLSGYLSLAERLWRKGPEFSEAWNFGPDQADARPVQWLIGELAELWGDGAGWRLDARPQFHEAGCLRLDCAKAKARLDWRPRWDLAAGLARTVARYRAHARGEDMRALTLAQIADFSEEAWPWHP